ncbi:serine/threonine-protein kinase [Chloroflexus sp.]|uniref:serine/threonine-protein kinase n=2 Tax=Chloroflexus sp. TaxID=1904827 RepID=UPI00298F0CDD|nr:serine/threonine-protein kinase [Chloroflexus sp.]MDW8403025.1 serine/threonine-protein kinase [Chloroflexus sp.]
MIAPETVLQGRYRIITQIAKGGMGAVYQARDLRLRIDVALKQTLFNDEAYRQAFEREAQILARLRHQALPRVIDHFIDPQGQFLVMEFIHGEDLGNQLARLGRRFASPQVLPMVIKWMDQLLDVLTYLHTRPVPVIHRDIKPKNLKLTPSHDIILLDFGLARGGMTVSAGIEGSGTRKVYGFTPPYAPYEQMRDGEPDPRSDIYSLSATLYHLLTGTLPPDAMTRMARLVNGQPDPLRPIRSLAPHVPEGLAQLIEQGMATLIDQRPQSAREMREALHRLRGKPAAAAAPAALRPISQPPAPSASTPPPVSDTTETPPALPPVETPPSPSPAPVGTMLRRLITGSQVRSVAFSPDGKWLLAGYDDYTVGIWDASTGEQVASLRGHESTVRTVAWHPDGKLAATGSDDETVRLWRTDDWQPLQIIQHPSCPIESIGFSPDGRYLAVGGWGNAITLYEIRQGKIEPIGLFTCPFVHSLHFSPDGSLLAAGCYDGAIYLWQVADHRQLDPISGFNTFIYSVAFDPSGSIIAASSGATIRLWRLKDRLLLDTLQGHTAPVRELAFSPRSPILASVSEDRSVRFWQVEHAQPLPLILEHSAGVSCLSFSPDGQLLATGAHDGRICLWQAPTQ